MSINLEAININRENATSLYIELARQLESQINNTNISNGTRLPAQRTVATKLDLNVATVTKAYRLLIDKGLVITRAGGGSIINKPYETTLQVNKYSSMPLSGSIIDLTVNRPATNAYTEKLKEIMPYLMKDPLFSIMGEYQEPEGPLWLREAISNRLNIDAIIPGAKSENIIITNGAQHALYTILQMLIKPGDTVLADNVTYQGIIALSRILNFNLVGVDMDDEGMIPESLEEKCTKLKPSAVILIPTLHNPTTISLSEQRKKQIHTITNKLNIPIIEDDIYRWFFEEKITSITALNPKLHFYVGSLSKAVAPGLRIGFIHSPEKSYNTLSSFIRDEAWCIAPLNMLAATHILNSNALNEIVNEHKKELNTRHTILKSIVGHYDLNSHPDSLHAWLKLPSSCNISRLVSAAYLKGVAVLGSDLFALSENAKPAVRINISAPRSQADFKRALRLLLETVEQTHKQTNIAGVF